MDRIAAQACHICRPGKVWSLDLAQNGSLHSISNSDQQFRCLLRGTMWHEQTALRPRSREHTVLNSRRLFFSLLPRLGPAYIVCNLQTTVLLATALPTIIVLQRSFFFIMGPTYLLTSTAVITIWSIKWHIRS